MRKLLLLSAALALGGGASAAENGKCDAKPFTLNKPVEAPRAADQPKTELAARSTSTSAAATPARKKPTVEKPRLLATCKDKAKKG